MKKEYVEYWSARGQYGLERIARAKRRKELRKLKRTGNKCPHCGGKSAGRYLCPCDEEFGYKVYCKCCVDCRNDCALSI